MNWRQQVDGVLAVIGDDSLPVEDRAQALRLLHSTALGFLPIEPGSTTLRDIPEDIPSEWTSLAVLTTLSLVGSDDLEPEILQTLAGEVIAEIWIDRREFDAVALARLTHRARQAAEREIGGAYPEWLE